MGSEALVNGHHADSNLLRNDIPTPWIVQKFGGTSVGKFPDQIADKIVKYARLGWRIARSTIANFHIAKASSALVWLLSALPGVTIQKRKVPPTGLHS